MTDTTILPFSFPAVGRKKLTADFDGGRLTSDGGVMLLAMAERRLGIADRLARAFPDRRDPSRITHTLADMIRARAFAIACGYEDADDLDSLRVDPAFKLACGRLPETGADLCSQPTLSRLENAPSLKDAIRLTYALVDQWMASYQREPASVILDIDDTCDVVHGHQQLSLFNAHYDERCFLPIHVYDTERSRPVAVVLRPGKTPSGVEVRAHLRRLVRHVRKRCARLACAHHKGNPKPDSYVRRGPLETGSASHASGHTVLIDKYCSWDTGSSQVMCLPSSASWIARCCMALWGAAPCQCFSPGAIQIVSPGRISLTGSPSSWNLPSPDMTWSV